MEDLIIDFLFYLNIALFIVFTFSSLVIIYFIYKGYKTGEEIKKKTYELGKGLTNKKVKDYLIFVRSIEVPNRKVYWNTLRAGYKLIKVDNNVDGNFKRELKILMLSKGILVE